MKLKLYIHVYTLALALFLLPLLAQGQEVTWRVASGDITLPSTTTPLVDGLASLTPTCGTVAGPFTVEASIPDTDDDGQRETVLFTGQCNAGPATQIMISLGNGQIGIVGQNLAAACVVQAIDQFGNITSTVGIAVP